jgi:chemotaxis protein methyltransferase CheR
MMNEGISRELLSRLSEHLSVETGLHFPEKRWNELGRKMGPAMKDFGFQDVAEFVQWLLSSRRTRMEIEILASHLTVGETYFFREKKALEILEHSILRELIESRRNSEKRIRMWSAGCSTGEEAYSLAIILHRLLPDINDWNISILATDINPQALQKAGEGVYSDWSFRDAPPMFKEKYFERTGENRYRINGEIKTLVTFSYLNLSEDVYPSVQNNTNAMDVILCRNVLMYFTPECMKMAAERFHRSLVEGGCLIVSPVEISHVTYSLYDTAHYHDSILYRKDSGRTRPSAKTPDLPDLVEKETLFYPLLSKKAKPPKSVRRREAAGEEILAAREESASAAVEEARDLYRKGLYGEAEVRLAGLVSGDNGTREAAALLSRIFANQGKLEDAVKWGEKAIAADKVNPGLYYLLATILEEQGKTEKAIKSLNKALYLDHNFVLAHFALANLMRRLGKIAESRKHIGNVAEMLRKYGPEETLPESEGMTAGRLSELIARGYHE